MAFFISGSSSGSFGRIEVDGDIVPKQAEAYDLGTADLPFRDLHVSSGSIKMYAGTEEIARIQVSDDDEFEFFSTKGLSKEQKKTFTKAQIRSNATPGKFRGGNIGIAGSSTGSFAKIGIGGTPTSQFSVIADSAIKNIHLYTNSDAAITTDTGARIFTTGDGGSGMYGENGHLVIQGRPAARDIIFLTGGSATERMRIKDSGNVGIGSTNPQQLLDVGGNARVAGNLYFNNMGIISWDSATAEFRVNATSGNELKLGANGSSSHITVTTGGNVGINKTAPTDTLHVAGGITMEAANAILAMNVTNTTGACQIRFGDTGDSDIGKIVYGHSTNAMTFNTADAERLRIDSSGNVGIGATSPTALLHIQKGSSSDTDFTNTNNPEAHHGILLNNNRFEAGSFTAITMNTANGSSVNGVSIIAQSAASGHAGKMIFARRALSSTVESMRIDENGNIGIGSTSPGKKLVVETTTDYDGILVRDVNDIVRLFNGSANDGYIQLLHGNAVKNQIHSNGNTYFNGGNVGIGDTSPDDKLTVYGGTEHIRVGNADANHTRIGRNTSTGAFEMMRTLTGVTDQVFFQANEANMGNISFPVGQVSIGTTATYGQLTIGNTGEQLSLRATSGTAKLVMYEAGTGRATLETIGGQGGLYIKTPTAIAAMFLNNLVEFPIANYKISGSATSTGSFGKLMVGGSEVTAGGGSSVWTTAGSEIYFNNNVGIGTTNPEQLLHIEGNAALSLLESTGTNQNSEFQFKTTARVFGIGQNIGTTGKFEIYDRTAGATRLAVDSSGNVGIGTAAPNANARLHIYKTGNNHLWVDSDATADVGFFGRHNGTGIFAIFDDHSDSKLRIVNYQAEPIEFSVDRAGTETVVMTMLNSGNVGIGNTNPGAKLAIGGSSSSGLHDIRLENSSAQIKIGVAGGGSDIVSSAVAGDFIISNVTGGTKSILFGIGTSEHMRVDHSGNVGIGVTDPDTKLEVDGIIAATGANRKIYVGESSLSAGTFGFMGWNDSSNYLYLGHSYNSAFNADIVIEHGGNVGIGTTNPDGTLHVHTDTAGAIAGHVSADDLVVENSDHGGISILTPNNKTGAIYFGDPQDNNIGALHYNHLLNKLIVTVAAADRFSLSSNTAEFGSTIAKISGSSISTGSFGKVIGSVDIPTGRSLRTSRIRGRSPVAVDTNHTNMNITGSLIISGSDLTFNKPVFGGNTLENFFRIKLQNFGGTTNDVGIGQGASGNMGFNVSANGYYDFYEGTNGLKMRFINGRLGIGVTSPVTKLDVDGSILAGRSRNIGSYASDDFDLMVANGSNDATAIALFNNAGSYHTGLIEYYSNKLSLGLNNSNSDDALLATSAITITSTGVGINRTSPGYKFEVGGVILGTGGVYSHDKILAGNSTDSAPSFALMNDPDTGWRSDLSNNMRFITGGTARMVLDSSGNVGIGTTTPSTALHLRSTADQEPYITIEQAGANVNSGGITMANFDTQDNDILGTIRFKGKNDTPIVAEYATIYSRAIDVSAGSIDGELHFRTVANNTLATRMIIQSGNVGIGTTSPDSMLEVRRDETSNQSLIRGNINYSAITIQGDYTNSTYLPALSWATADNSATAPKASIYIHQDNTGSTMILGTSNAYANGVTNDGLCIDPIGQIGIGTQSPSYELDITAASGTAEARLYRNANVKTSLRFQNSVQHWEIGNSVAANQQFAIYDHTNSRELFTLGTAGAVFNEGGSSVDFRVETNNQANALFIKGSTDRVGILTNDPKDDLHIKNSNVGGGHAFGSKALSLTTSYNTNAQLTVNITNHGGCFVKVFIAGDWSGHSTIAYLGEFMLQNGGGSYKEPGMIVRQVDNTHDTDSVEARIVDPSDDNFVIQWRLNQSTGGTTATGYMQYEVMGMFNTIT